MYITGRVIRDLRKQRGDGTETWISPREKQPSTFCGGVPVPLLVSLVSKAGTRDREAIYQAQLILHRTR